MPTSVPEQHSLFDALDRASERPVIRRGYAPILPRFLAPEETVLLALLGDGWTSLDPLVLVTDRRVLRLRETVTGGWRLRREVTATAVRGAQLQPGAFFGRVRILTADGDGFETLYRDEPHARAFVDALNSLVTR